MAGFRDFDRFVVPTFLMILFYSLWVEAHPASVTRMGPGEGTPVWYRLENGDLSLDFSSANTFRIDRFEPSQSKSDLAAQVEENPVFWQDIINGEEAESASADMLKPKEPDDCAALRVFGAPVQIGATPVEFEKTVRLFSEGAQIEVGYLVRNEGSETASVSYSVRLPWKIAAKPEGCVYHLPAMGAIREVHFEELAGSVQIEGLELSEHWFGATSAENDQSCLFASDEPFVSWTATQEKDGEPIVEVVVWEGKLKPGEKHEGTSWVAAVSGLGTPVSVSGQYAAGVAWKPGFRFASYCLESRIAAMPRGLKKFRLFSATRRTPASVALVPLYTRRSRLSPTSVYSIPMPGSFDAGTCYLEQSIYSSSENVGYWNVALKTPGKNSTQVATSPSGPLTTVSYFIPPQEETAPAKGRDYHSSLPDLTQVRAQPEDPSADEIALLEWPNWEGAKVRDSKN